MAALNRGCSPLDDTGIKDFFQYKILNLRATLDKKEAYEDAEFVIIATSTDYDTCTTDYFNAETVESVIQDVLVINPQGT